MPNWFDDNAPDQNLRARAYPSQTLTADAPPEVQAAPDMPVRADTPPATTLANLATAEPTLGASATPTATTLPPQPGPDWVKTADGLGWVPSTHPLAPQAPPSAATGTTSVGGYTLDPATGTWRTPTGAVLDTSQIPPAMLAAMTQAAQGQTVTSPAGQPTQATTTTPTTTGVPGAAATATPTNAATVAANGNPTYWQNVSTEDFGSLLQPWGQAFSYEAFQSPEPFVAGTLKTPADMAANPNPTGNAPDWSTDPGYDFRLREGQKALERSAAAKGTLLNGGTLKSLNDYSQNVASAEYGNIYNRKYGEYTDTYNRSKADYTTGYNKALGEYQTAFNVFGNNQNNMYNRLAGLSGLGQSSSNQLASTGLGYSQLNAQNSSTYANNYGNLLTQGANAQAAGVIGSQNAQTNYANQLMNLASSYPWG